jgi:hypothetical protein
MNCVNCDKELAPIFEDQENIDICHECADQE